MTMVEHGFAVSITGLSLQESLRERGPRLDVLVSVRPDVEALLREQGIEIPSPQSGKALIDTGAHTTHIDAAAIARLQLPFLKNQDASVTGGVLPEEYYGGVLIEFPRSDLPSFTLETIASGALAHDGLLAVIGRDVLRSCVFTYDGVSGKAMLAVPDEAVEGHTGTTAVKLSKV